MKKIHLRKKYIIKKRLSTVEKIILVIILLFIFLIISFKYMNKTVTPILMNYAEIETKKFMNSIINKAISETKIENIDELFIINKTDNQINTIDFNVNVINKLLADVSSKIQESIKLMEQGKLTNIPGYDNDKLKQGIIYEIPSGTIFENNILSNLGPKIPVKISTRGNISSNIDTNLTNYGINNALIKVNLKLVLDEQIVLPFSLKTIEITNSIPITMKIIEGVVPKYYSNGLNESSPIISLPLEEN